MAKIDLGKIVAVAVAAGASQVASAPNNDMKSQDVPAVITATTEMAKPAIAEAQAQLDHATDQEPFYLSRQWWTAMLGVAGSLAGVAGYAFPAEMQQQVLSIIMAGVGVVTAATLFYNRYFAKKPIGQ